MIKELILVPKALTRQGMVDKLELFISPIINLDRKGDIVPIVCLQFKWTIRVEIAQGNVMSMLGWM